MRVYVQFVNSGSSPRATLVESSQCTNGFVLNRQQAALTILHYDKLTQLARGGGSGRTISCLLSFSRPAYPSRSTAGNGHFDLLRP